MDKKERDEKFHAQTTEQYAALGRFVQSYEQMVDGVRRNILFLLGDGTNVTQKKINIVLHHQVMSSGPLIDIYQALIHHEIEIERPTDPAEAEAISELIQYISKNYREMQELRNNLLHATWRIGWAHPDDDDFSFMSSTRGVTGKTGVKYKDLPNTASELNDKAKEVDRIAELMFRLFGCMTGTRYKITRNFTKRDGVWHPHSPSSIT